MAITDVDLVLDALEDVEPGDPLHGWRARCPVCGTASGIKIRVGERGEPFADGLKCRCYLAEVEGWVGAVLRGESPWQEDPSPSPFPARSAGPWPPHRGAAPSSTPPAPEPWEELVPLDRLELPAFPVAQLPEWLGAMVEAVSKATQTPPDAAAMTALAVLATAAALRAQAMPRRGWCEPLNLWTVVALPPGNMKSAVDAEMKAPVLEYQAELARAMRAEIAAAAVDREIMEKRLERLKQEAVKAEDPAARAALQREAEALAAELASARPQVAPRLLCDDITPERLGMLMHEQGGRIAVLSPEGTVFAGMAGHYNSGQINLDVYKKGHSGDPVDVERVGRPWLHIPRPALTLGLLVQPDVIARLNDRQEMRGEGLLARFLYAVPHSWLGRRDVRSEPVPEAVRASYHVQVRRLLALPADTDAAGQPRPHRLPFTEEAAEAVAVFREWLEPQLGTGGELEHLAGWGGKLHGALVRLAALLHLAAQVRATQPWRTPVDAKAVAAAITICRYLIPHAKAAFGLMNGDPTLAGAREVLEWVQRRGARRFTRRELHQALHTRFPSVADLNAPLGTLAERGYLRCLPKSERTTGGRPSWPAYEVNPAALGQNGAPGGF